MVKKINVRSLDFDGCLFNKKYLSMSVSDTRLVKANQGFLSAIAKSIKSSKFDEVILMVGSNRQSKAIDDMNLGAWSKGKIIYKESCYPAMAKLLAALQAKVSKIPCRVDDYLLADTYGDLKPGTNFKNAVAENKEFKFSEWVFDESKLSILYAQMHKIASEHPKDHIVFDFYDDRAGAHGLLTRLHQFFAEYPETLPKNIILRMHHYDGGKIHNLKHVRGTGKIDKNYHENVKLMAKLADCEFTGQTGGKCFLLDNLRILKRVEQFIYERVLKPGGEPMSLVRGASLFQPMDDDSCSTTEELDLDPGVTRQDSAPRPLMRES